MSKELETILGICSGIVSICALLIAFKGFKRTSKKDYQEEAVTLSSIKQSMDTLQKDVTDIKRTVGEQGKAVSEISERVARIEGGIDAGCYPIQYPRAADRR